ncbi:endonuclease domain-containing protein [Streptomyces cellostaticus]|uniref:endonuclease domain-containing protein n=1 Tax=Streptomyces cellostaticus TaxID=67285 RepID=UPI0035A90274
MKKARVHRAGGKICSFEGCGKPHHAKGLCRAHRVQQLEGRPLKPLARSQLTKVEYAAIVQAGVHTCRSCSDLLPLTEFYRKGPRISMACKVCTQDQVTARSFGFSDIDELVIFRLKHRNKCGICGYREGSSERNKRLAIDHDHTCCPEPGRGCQKCIRGLLCARCNPMIGYYELLPKEMRTWDVVNKYLARGAAAPIE